MLLQSVHAPLHCILTVHLAHAELEVLLIAQVSIIRQKAPGVGESLSVVIGVYPKRVCLWVDGQQVFLLSEKCFGRGCPVAALRTPSLRVPPVQY